MSNAIATIKTLTDQDARKICKAGYTEAPNFNDNWIDDWYLEQDQTDRTRFHMRQKTNKNHQHRFSFIYRSRKNVQLVSSGLVEFNQLRALKVMKALGYID